MPPLSEPAWCFSGGCVKIQEHYRYMEIHVWLLLRWLSLYKWQQTAQLHCSIHAVHLYQVAGVAGGGWGGWGGWVYFTVRCSTGLILKPNTMLKLTSRIKFNLSSALWLWMFFFFFVRGGGEGAEVINLGRGQEKNFLMKRGSILILFLTVISHQTPSASLPHKKKKKIRVHRTVILN